MSALAPARGKQIEALVASLPSRASLIVRLVYRYAARHAGFDLNASATGILLALLEGPRRITELAELEGQTQPYVTKLVSDLEARGWASRARDPEDGRAVSVHITDEGRAALKAVRGALRDMLTERMSRLSDAQLDSLGQANQALLLLVDTLQQETAR